MKKLKKKEALILVFALIVGFALRFYAFDQKSLWVDEIYTFNDSRYDIKNQIAFYKSESTYPHPPLFFLLTHLLYPSEKPERDLRIIPLIFGTLSIPMIYLLARQFSLSVALPCTLSLTFMAYHISLSQEGRPYSFLLFFGMMGLYFFMKHLQTSNKKYLFLVAFFFSILFYTSYSSIPFIALCQILWFYQTGEEKRKNVFFSFLLLNGMILMLILPWLCFLGLNYKGESLTVPYHTEDPGPLINILYGLIHDWAMFPILLIISVILLMLFPLFSTTRKNALVLLCLLIFPVGSLYVFCKVWSITHFITSRYFINLLPLFLISLYSSAMDIEIKFKTISMWIRPSILLLILFIISNLLFFSYYYDSEKMDFRRLTTYLKTHLQEKDKIFVVSPSLMPGLLHYFGNIPIGRQDILYPIIESGEIVGYHSPLVYEHSTYSIYYSKRCCNQYVADGSRVWIIVFKQLAKDFKKGSPAVLKESFNGKVLNLHRFPTDASMYLFLWDPRSSDEKGVDMPIE